MKIERLAEVSSTNTYIKKYLPYGEDVIVCARRQTGGMGTKGRSFLSDEGGVYLTYLKFYEHVPASRAFEVMAHAAVAVCRTAEGLGGAPEIKWANDVLLHRRKLCGILIENGISDGELRYSIVGIGVNVTNDLSALGGIAASLSELAPVTVEDTLDRLIAELLRPSDFSDYLARIRFLGSEIEVAEGEARYRAVAERILPDGRLAVTVGGATRILSSAEISIQIH